MLLLWFSSDVTASDDISIIKQNDDSKMDSGQLESPEIESSIEYGEEEVAGRVNNFSLLSMSYMLHFISL